MAETTAIVQIKLVMSPEDRETIELLKELRGSSKTNIEAPVQLSPEAEFQIAKEGAFGLREDNREITGTGRREWENWFRNRPQYKFLLELAKQMSYEDLMAISLVGSGLVREK